MNRKLTSIIVGPGTRLVYGQLNGVLLNYDANNITFSSIPLSTADSEC
jgi:hypothetical protein